MTNPNNLTTQPPYFGKYQRYVTIAVLICYQMLVVPWGLYNLYVLFTLDIYMLSIIAIICAIQFPVRKSQTFIKIVNKYIRPTTYFKKFTRLTQEKIDPNQKTIYGYHPHSIFSYSMLLNMNRGDPQIPDYIGLGSRFGFNAPILGMILRLWGCSHVYKQNLKSLMQEGKKVALVPGGYEEATLTTTKQMRFYIKNRKGFIKYALMYGYTIRPVVCIGQNQAFETFDSLKSIRLLLNRLKLPTVFFINWKYLCFMDPNLELTTIVGKGIKKENVDPNYQPTLQDIDHYHKLYVEQLTRLYNKYKHLNGNKPLVIM